MLVPLQDAAAGWYCRIFLRSSRRRSVARGEWLQRKELTSSNLPNVQSFRIVQNWEYASETHFFFNSGSFVDSGSFVA